MLFAAVAGPPAAAPRRARVPGGRHPEGDATYPEGSRHSGGPGACRAEGANGSTTSCRSRRRAIRGPRGSGSRRCRPSRRALACDPACDPARVRAGPAESVAASPYGHLCARGAAPRLGRSGRLRGTAELRRPGGCVASPRGAKDARNVAFFGGVAGEPLAAPAIGAAPNAGQADVAAVAGPALCWRDMTRAPASADVRASAGRAAAPEPGRRRRAPRARSLARPRAGGGGSPPPCLRGARPWARRPRGRPDARGLADLAPPALRGPRGASIRVLGRDLGKAKEHQGEATPRRHPRHNLNTWLGGNATGSGSASYGTVRTRMRGSPSKPSSRRRCTSDLRGAHTRGTAVPRRRRRSRRVDRLEPERLFIIFSQLVAVDVDVVARGASGDARGARGRDVFVRSPAAWRGPSRRRRRRRRPRRTRGSRRSRVQKTR